MLECSSQYEGWLEVTDIFAQSSGSTTNWSMKSVISAIICQIEPDNRGDPLRTYKLYLILQNVLGTLKVHVQPKWLLHAEWEQTTTTMLRRHTSFSSLCCSFSASFAAFCISFSCLAASLSISFWRLQSKDGKNEACVVISRSVSPCSDLRTDFWRIRVVPWREMTQCVYWQHAIARFMAFLDYIFNTVHPAVSTCEKMIEHILDTDGLKRRSYFLQCCSRDGIRLNCKESCPAIAGP